MGAVKMQSIRTGGWHDPTTSGESKYIDILTNPTFTAGVSTFTTPQLLNGTAPGSGSTNRIGRKFTMKSIYFRGYFSMAPTSTGGSPFRIIIYYDKQANATAAAKTDLLTNDNFVSPNNLDNRDRFVVICDMVTNTASNNGDNSVAVNFYKKINLETYCNAGTAGTIADITSGSVFVMFAQDGAIATAAPTSQYWTRIRFTDI